MVSPERDPENRETRRRRETKGEKKRGSEGGGGEREGGEKGSDSDTVYRILPGLETKGICELFFL